jgi:hypothetical protein
MTRKVLSTQWMATPGARARSGVMKCTVVPRHSYTRQRTHK